MSKTINEKARELFQRLKGDFPKDKMKIVNTWVAENTSSKNLPLFLAQGDETTKKRLCIMMQKAMDNDDFSAFTGEAEAKPAEPKEEPKPEPEKKADESKAEKPKEESKPKDEPKDEPKKGEPKAEPKTASEKQAEGKATQAKDEPAPSGSIDSMFRTIAGAVAKKEVREALANQGKGEPMTNETIVKAVCEAIKSDGETRNAIRSIVKEELLAHFERMMKG